MFYFAGIGICLVIFVAAIMLILKSFKYDKKALAYEKRIATLSHEKALMAAALERYGNMVSVISAMDSQAAKQAIDDEATRMRGLKEPWKIITKNPYVGEYADVTGIKTRKKK